MSGFKKTLAGSIVLHAILIAAGALIFASGTNRVFITPVYTVDLVSNGPRQAVMAPPAPPAPPVEKAPEVTPEPVKAAAEKAPEEKAAPAAAETVKIKSKPSVDEALKKIEKKIEKRNDEALVASSIDSLKKKLETERRGKSERVSKLKEEIGSRGEAASRPQPPAPSANPASAGAPRASLEARYPAYYGLIRDRVQENWIYPEGLKDNRISVIVSIKIARNGKLLDVSVEKSSGNHAFDSSLLKAVKKAAPFPPLPVNMEGSFLETGLRFCPGCAQ